VLAVDPGRDKCGLAIVDSEAGVLTSGVVPTETVGEIARLWARQHRPSLIVCGKGTGSAPVRRALEALALPVHLCVESHTTERARRRYFEEHPPEGWRRLIPLGLQTPPIPVDDYAAILIAEDYLRSADEPAF
jgi:RNase H-fold protein (predicted Holliday junction resolvase)